MDRATKTFLGFAIVFTVIASVAIVLAFPSTPQSGVASDPPATHLAAVAEGKPAAETIPAVASAAPAEIQTVADGTVPINASQADQAYDRASSGFNPPTTRSRPSVTSSEEPRVHVRGYVRKDGTYVAPYTRSYPRSKK